MIRLSRLICALLFTCYFFCLPAALYAQPLSSTELIADAGNYDGKNVIYEGEVIGDIMVRGDHAWVNVNDGQNAIGVWMEKALVKDILYAGSYKSRGDSLEISGVFHRACLQHGGDLDIHAQAVRKISAGRPITERLNTGKRSFVFILLGVLCLVWILRPSRPK